MADHVQAQVQDQTHSPNPISSIAVQARISEATTRVRNAAEAIFADPGTVHPDLHQLQQDIQTLQTPLEPALEQTQIGATRALERYAEAQQFRQQNIQLALAIAQAEGALAQAEGAIEAAEAAP